MSKVQGGGPGTGMPGFDSLLATGPVDSADAAPTADPGEHTPVAQTDSGPQLVPVLFDFSDREPPRRPRTSVLGWISLVFAFVAPPLGLVLSVIARIVARHRHGWRTWPVTLATVVSVSLTIVLIVGALVAGILGTQTAGVDAIVAESAEFCDSLAETPGVLDTAGFGWPTESSSVTTSITAMTAYRDRWTELAGIAPSAIADDAAALATVAGTIVDNATASQSIDPQGSLDQVSDVANSTGIRAYTNKYCR